MKKTLALVLSLIMVFVMSISASAATSDSTKYYGMSKDEIQKEFLKNIEVIEKYIESKGTTVLKELSKEMKRLETILASETNMEDRAKLENL